MQQRAGLFDGLEFGPWIYTCIGFGRRLTYRATTKCADGCQMDVKGLVVSGERAVAFWHRNASCLVCGDGYHVVLDGKFDAETAKQWIGHLEHKPWVTEVAVRELRKALRQALGLRAKEEPPSQPEPEPDTTQELEPEESPPT
jgi:hypothetical protein